MPLRGDEVKIYEAIHTAIADRQLPAGTRLVEENLATLFNVSRARIRSVLQGLARDKVVTLQPNRGAVVAQPSPEEAREVFSARRLIEEAITRHAARTIDQTGLAILKKHLEQERAAHRLGDRRAAIKLSGEFHLKLAEVIGNATLLGYLRELIVRSSLIIAVYESPGAHNCSLDEHQGLIDALAEHDAETAAKVMDDHLAEIENRLALSPAAAEPLDFKAIFKVG